MAAQLAARGGATVIGTVRRSTDLAQVDDTLTRRVALDEADPVRKSVIRVTMPTTLEAHPSSDRSGQDPAKGVSPVTVAPGQDRARTE
jgi:NADPH:quinone reductase